MAIRKKIEKFNSVISKGGYVAADIEEKKNEWLVTSLRITSEIIERIDKCRSKRTGTSRNAWILDAIQEKLEKQN